MPGANSETMMKTGSWQMEVNPVSGNDIRTLLRRVYAMPAGLIERAKRVVK